MQIGIFTNLNKDHDLKITKAVVDVFNKKQPSDIFLHEQISSHFNKEFNSFNEHSDLKLDMMIAIGGDGTILRIAKFCARTDTPIMGVNLGKLGFLADIEPKEIAHLADMILSKNYQVEERDLIEANLNNQSFWALNEVVVARRSEGIVSLKVSVNEVFLDNFICDGFIVATSVGSTAYSLSAGGPILSPFSEAFVLNPINSHSLYTRPVVINNKESVKLELNSPSSTADLIIDGVKTCKMCSNEQVKISKAIKNIKFIRPRNHNFYSKMFAKFTKN